ncbi:cob(I)yrinic acid a,c-diamide adenosyltransferase [Candidatus Uhrbacteria bacterium]|nr:cob(I)yrinic acid a,c-diamide adenosyltransferase [Candidatus Uhrbacteria bacterium]
MDGLVQVYTGNGKGKTTAALGLAVRARAAGKRVAMVFFDKGGEHYSERKLLAQLGVVWFGYGLDRIDPKTERFRFGVLDEDVSQAAQGIAKARELLQQFLPLPGGGASGGGQQPFYDLVILDEVNTTVALGMLEEHDVNALIDAKPPTTELVLTGRIEISRATRPLHCDGSCVTGGGAVHEHRPSYFDRADLVTEMRLVKHYFYLGTPAREGLDY